MNAFVYGHTPLASLLLDPNRLRHTGQGSNTVRTPRSKQSHSHPAARDLRKAKCLQAKRLGY